MVSGAALSAYGPDNALVLHLSLSDCTCERVPLAALPHGRSGAAPPRTRADTTVVRLWCGDVCVDVLPGGQWAADDLWAACVQWGATAGAAASPARALAVALRDDTQRQSDMDVLVQELEAIRVPRGYRGVAKLPAPPPQPAPAPASPPPAPLAARVRELEASLEAAAARHARELAAAHARADALSRLVARVPTLSASRGVGVVAVAPDTTAADRRHAVLLQLLFNTERRLTEATQRAASVFECVCL